MRVSHILIPIGTVLAGVGFGLMDGTLILVGCGVLGMPAMLHVKVDRVPEELPEARAMRKEDEAIEREKALFVKGELTQEEFESSVQRILDRRPTDDSYEAKIEARERRLKRQSLRHGSKCQCEACGLELMNRIIDGKERIASAYAVPSHTMGGTGGPLEFRSGQGGFRGECDCPSCLGVADVRYCKDCHGQGTIYPMDEPVEYFIGAKVAKLPAKRLTS